MARKAMPVAASARRGTGTNSQDRPAPVPSIKGGKQAMLEKDAVPQTTQSRLLHERARDVSPLGVHGNGRWYEPFPLYFSRAAGARLWDVDGNEYIDLHGGLG